jgi:alpha-beta hydrolase superfamily lysophospholipase
LLGTVGAREQVLCVQSILLEHGGRPHWGQMHHFTEGAVEEMYPDLQRWRRVAEELNRTGVFDNTFSDRIGLSGPSRPFGPESRRVPIDWINQRRTERPDGLVRGAWDDLHVLGAADGCKITIYDYAPRSHRRRHPVLLVHGVGCDAHVWDLLPVGLSFADHLRTLGFHVFTVDLRGRTRSDRPDTGLRDWTLDEYVGEDLPCAVRRIRAMTGAERVHLVGHGIGGVVCLLFQMRGGGDAIRSVVTLGSALRYPSLDARVAYLAKLFRVLLVSPSVPIGRFYRSLARISHLAMPWNALLYNCDNVRPADAAGFARTAVHDVARGEARQLLRMLDEGRLTSVDGDYNYTDGAPLVTAPLLALGGDRDLYCSHEALRWTVAKVGSTDKELRVFGRIHGDRSHYGHLDLVWGVHAPHDVWPVVDRWLEDHDEPSAQH